MANLNTKIEWADATWSPVTGCSKVSQGCKNCYAERLFPKTYPGRKFTDVRYHPERLFQPLSWMKPKRIFVNSMSDLFHESVSDQQLTDIFGIMGLAHWHTFQVLTKRPERALGYLKKGSHGIIEQFQQIEQCGGISKKEVFRALDIKRRDHIEWKWPFSNVWLGVSVEDQKTAEERIPLLLQTPAAVRWVSYEPALGPVDFYKFLPLFSSCDGNYELKQTTPCPDCGDVSADERLSLHINWIVAGGESGPKARPSHPDWFRSVRDQCQSARVPFLFEQWGQWHPVQYFDQFNKPILKISLPSPESMKPFNTEIVWKGVNMRREGKKKSAGRLLDGREWNEFPVQHLHKPNLEADRPAAAPVGG